MNIAHKRTVLIVFFFAITICLLGLIMLTAFGIGSSDHFIVNRIKKSLASEDKQQILLSWVDETFGTHELTEKLAAISCDDTDKGILPGKKVCHQAEATWEQSGVWAKEARLLRSHFTGEYTSVYLGNARFGTIVRFSYVAENDIGLNFDKRHVIWHKDRIYIIMGPLFVAGKQNNGIDQ